MKISAGLLGLFVWAVIALGQQADSFRFVVLGDRTGDVQPGVYEQVWRDIRREGPAFIAGIGDTIQGGNDAAAPAEWREVERIVTPDWWKKLYLAPGNHDIWSPESERQFRQHAGHPLHYSFDYEQAHFTVLDNSQTDEMPSGEMEFLESDLRNHASQPVKIILSHRPSWLFGAILHNPEFALQRLAKRYGVQYVIAGHTHEMLHAKVENVTYITMASAGGHLRASKKYEDGWFFGYGVATVAGSLVKLELKELRDPFGEGRISAETDWGITGLTKK